MGAGLGTLSGTPLTSTTAVNGDVGGKLLPAP